MGFISEFKEFAVKGNVMDLAVGVIIGGAFGKIVSSLVEDVVMPPIGLLIGNVDIANLYIPLSDKVRMAVNNAGMKGVSLAEAKKLGAVLAYGNFLSNVITFLIVGLVVFLLVRLVNRLRPAPVEVPAAPVTPPEELLLTEIRDLLKERR